MDGMWGSDGGKMEKTVLEKQFLKKKTKKSFGNSFLLVMKSKKKILKFINIGFIGGSKLFQVR